MTFKIKAGVLLFLLAQYSYALDNSTQIEKLQVMDNSQKLYAFDARALFGRANQDLDLRYYTRLNQVTKGTYSLNTSLNNESALGQLTIKFEQPDPEQAAILCVDQTLLKRLDLRADVLARLAALSPQSCLNIREISPDASYDMDAANLTLNISLPLVLINQRPRGYIAPEKFDRGVSAAYLGYDFNRYISKQNDFSSSSNYLSLNGGFNLGAFSYRHAGSFTSNDEDFGKYNAYLNVLSTDILPLEARLSAGEFSTQSYSIESAPIVGLQLASDPSMRPMSQRSFTPVIRGVANSNALVSILQNGRKIFERTVPTGAFEFNDLSAMDNAGDLTVEIAETSGEKRSFIVPMQSNMNLIRVGQLNYNVAAGYYKINNKVTDDALGQVSLEYGLNNYLSLYTGTNQSPVFKNYLLGMGANTFFGGLRFDVEHSDASLAKQDYTGQKYQLAYRYDYLPLNTSFNLSTQHQSRQYLTLSNTMSLRNFDDLTNTEVENLFQSYRLKQQWNVSLYQSLWKDDWGSLYLNSSQRQYWDDPKYYQQYDIGYANHWKSLSYSISYSQSENNFNQDKEQRIYLNVSMPLSWRSQRANLNASMQHSDTSGRPTTANVGITGTVGHNNELGYSISTNQNWSDQQDRSSVSASVNYRLPSVQLGTVLGWSDDDQTQYGFSARGAVVAHRYGVTATNQISDTYSIIHAEGAKGAEVSNAWGVKIDRFGNAIYSNLAPYEANSLSIDSKNLPLDVQLASNQAEVIPRRYSATLLKFESEKTSNILLNVRMGGQQIPIGVQAMSADGQVVGMFGQSNQLFVEKADLLKQDIQVMWGATESKRCQIASPSLNMTKQSSKTFQIIDVECK